MPTIHEALASAKKQMEKRIDAALEKEVAETVKAEEVSVINETVYGVYHPKFYRRRGPYGGICDFHNMEHSVEKGKLSVMNVTEPNPGGTANDSMVTTGKDLPKLIEYGHGGPGGFYDWPLPGRRYIKPRPFTKKTIERLSDDKAHVYALKEGLKRQRIKVI